MSITKQFPVYTGTFTTQKGEKRTMSFIKESDLPQRPSSVSSRSRKLQPGFETVYDVDKQGYRTFNYNTLIGNVTLDSRTVTIQG